MTADDIFIADHKAEGYDDFWHRWKGTWRRPLVISRLPKQKKGHDECNRNDNRNENRMDNRNAGAEYPR